MSCVWTRAFAFDGFKAFLYFFASIGPDASNWDQPNMALSGVLNSCESVARNSSFMRLARWLQSLRLALHQEVAPFLIRCLFAFRNISCDF